MEQIDILLATYNGEKYLKEQLDSILNQTYTNFRLIISDDCSTDNTKQILNEYASKDNRIILYFQEKNVGYVRNFEFLLSKVENEIYALSDQDDIWVKEKIEKEIDTMKKEQSDLVFSDLMLIDEKNNIINQSFWKIKGFNKKIKKDKKYNGLRLNNYITGCTILSKKEFLKYILPIPKQSKYIIHDYWISIIISLKGKITYDDNKYVLYRQHSNNQVGYETKSEKLNSIDEIRKLFLDVKIDHYNLFKENKDLFDGKQIKENEKALKYFNRLTKIKYINFRNWFLFYKLYKYENFKYYTLNFIILNIPILAKLLYKNKRG